MKKILIIILISLAAFSCKKDFVEKLPTTSNVVENFYRTPEDASAALTAAYNTLTRDDYWGSMIISEIASDECAGGGGSGDGGGYQMYDRGLTQPGSAVNKIPWSTYYGAIFRANIYLQYESKIDWKGNVALQKQYQGEARFLRAYDHFYLARLFGEIPYLDHPLTPGEIPGRTPAADLYGSILEDLKYSAKNCLSAPYNSMDPANWGRATKWAAEAMIARVFLYYTGYYNQTDLKGFTSADALAMLDDVITNSNHQLVLKFASLWRVPCISELGSIDNYAQERNPEVVWSIIGSSNNGNYGASYFQRMIGPRGTNKDPYGQGWGAIPVLPSLWNLYDSTDTRRTATILNWDREKLKYDYSTNQQAQYTGYNSKKYELVSIKKAPEIAAGGKDWQTNGAEDYMIIRYADVLLMAAELQLIIGGSVGKATDYVNKVRERAYGDNSHNLASVTIDDIMKERKLELACEGIRYWDILRSCKGDFSKLVGILTNIDNSDGGDNSGSTSDVVSTDVDGNNFVEKKGLFQLPKNELNLMKNVIQQNPGYN